MRNRYQLNVAWIAFMICVVSISLAHGDQWIVTTGTNAPSARYQHTATWTGSKMIVWGGVANGLPRNTGSRYDPVLNSWTATTTSGAPDGRALHTAVWTGQKMVVWGGCNPINCLTELNTGGLYDPSMDSWTSTTTVGAPTARHYHTAVWTTTKMVIWGGYSSGTLLNSGAQYDPSANSWSSTSTTGAPSARWLHSAAWTGSKMIIWAGSTENHILNPTVTNTGGIYDPATDSWTSTSTTGAPTARDFHTAVWTGSQMIVWGGHLGAGMGNNATNTGGKYDPSTNSWSATQTTNAPAARWDHTAVYTGSLMIVWAGDGNGGVVNTGGKYDPSANSWTATTGINVPGARDRHTAIWSGNQMIVWGGADNTNGLLGDGSRYNP